MDIVRVVDSVKEDLKKEYTKSPSTIWDKPFVVIGQSGGRVGYLDANMPESAIMDWLLQFRGPREIEVIVVGRMVVKRNGLLDSMGKPIVTERAILVSGRSFLTGRTRVSITPIKEHRDYRTPDVIETQGTPLNPGLTSPDATKVIMAGNNIAGVMTAQFQDETILDSRSGDKCVLDPLIQGVLDGTEGPLGGI